MKSRIVRFERHNRRAVCFALLILFSLYLLLQHWQVFPYHDDWGYAVLSYVTEQTGFYRQQFSQGQLLAFLYEEYINWSPRFFAFFLQINLFKLGLDAVRLAQVVVVLGIVCLSMKVSIERILHPLLVVPLVYFLALPSFVTVGGLYWFSASIAYLWGILPLLLAALLLVQHQNMTWRVTSLLAVASLFQEQMAVATLGFVMIYLWLSYRGQSGWQGWKMSLLHCTPIVLAALLVILAPGNFSRKARSSYGADSLWATIGRNLETISEFIIATSSSTLALVLMLSSVGCLLWHCPMWHDPERKRRGAIVALVLVVLIALAQVTAVVAAMTLFLIWGVLLYIFASHSAKDRVVFAIFMAALASLSLLLVAPSVSGRSMLIFYILLMIPVVSAFSRMVAGSALGVAALLLASIAPFAVVNAATVFQGYAENRHVHIVNDAKLRALSHDLQLGRNGPDTVVLDKLPNDRYAETMPYQRPLIETWMKKYYGLPESLTFEWR